MLAVHLHIVGDYRVDREAKVTPLLAESVAARSLFDHCDTESSMAGEDWIDDWRQAVSGELTPDEIRFLRETEEQCPRSRFLWGGNREFVRLALEGPADRPRLVCYLRWERLHPGQLLAYEWPLRDVSESGAFLDPSMWIANCMETLEADPHPAPGADGVIRMGD